LTNAIILHGRPDRTEYFDPAAPSMSNAHWLPWLQGQLLKASIDAATPEVPHSYALDWDAWQREVERFDIGPQTTLIGHSTGAGFFVKYLSLHRELRVGRLVLVAPWIDPFAKHPEAFFKNFEIDPHLVQRTAGLTIFHSDNDQKDIQKTVEILREKLKPVTYREFHDYGHFCFEDMKATEFPELLAEVLRG
jgi:predicted alpha/beta hydrolase family esterase